MNENEIGQLSKGTPTISVSYTGKTRWITKRSTAITALISMLLSPQAALASPRIIGGNDSNPSDWPFYVELTAVNEGSTIHACGGALINENWILTAAHCILDDYPLKANIGLISNSSSDILWQYEGVDIDKIVVHPSWNIDTFAGDMALLKLRSPTSIPEDGYAKLPVPVPENDPLYPLGAEVVVAGMGAVSHDENYWPELPEYGTQPLKEVNIYVSQIEKCDSFPTYPFLPKYQICAGRGEFNPDNPESAFGPNAYAGDSGGPLMYTRPETRNKVILGVASEGGLTPEIDPNYPGESPQGSTFTIYSYVALPIFYNWIKETVKKN